MTNGVRHHSSRGGEHLLPISVKGIISTPTGVVLLRNPRHEWELPGGRLDPGEQPEDTLRREVREELGWDVTPLELVDATVFEPIPNRTVLVITYACEPSPSMTEVTASMATLSNEHDQVITVTPTTIDDVAGLPGVYINAITRWWSA